MNAWMFINYRSCRVKKGITTVLGFLNLSERVEESYEKFEK
jgi:hypothetical protein